MNNQEVKIETTTINETLTKEVLKCKGCNEDLTEKNCYKSFISRGFKVCSLCSEKAKKERYALYRLDILKRLGNQCTCCGNTNIELLSIDHIHGGGKREILNIGSFSKYLRKLNKMTDIELKNRYQALCYNCNYTRGIWGSTPCKWSEYDPNFKIQYPEYVFKGPENEYKCLTCDILINKETCGVLNGRRVSKMYCKTCENKRGNIEKQKTELLERKADKLEIRLGMIKAYGGKCQKCGEEHPLNLTLDHVNNNGNFEERGVGFYKYLKTLGYPGKDTQLQLLCHNCNAQKEYTETRKNNSVETKATAEEYVKQDYKLTKEEQKDLETKSMELLSQILKNKPENFEEK